MVRQADPDLVFLLLQEVRALAVSREVDPGGDLKGRGWRADPPLWRWRQRARRAVYGYA